MVSQSFEAFEVNCGQGELRSIDPEVAGPGKAGRDAPFDAPVSGDLKDLLKVVCAADIVPQKHHSGIAEATALALQFSQLWDIVSRAGAGMSRSLPPLASDARRRFVDFASLRQDGEVIQGALVRTAGSEGAVAVVDFTVSCTTGSVRPDLTLTGSSWQANAFSVTDAWRDEVSLDGVADLVCGANVAVREETPNVR